MFVLAVSGLAPLVRRELEARPGVTVTEGGHDGRSDVLCCEVDRDAVTGLTELGTVEDVFIEVGRTPRNAGDQAGWTAGRLWRGPRVEPALRLWSKLAGPGRGGRGQRGGGRRGPTTYRVVARVLQEKSYPRTELRRHLTRTIGADRHTWREDDPAQLEVWVVEYAAGKLLAGLRVSDVRMRQHGARASERPGALRPTVATAMVQLAGPPDGGLLLDPCCGSGTILTEAAARGWRVAGRDVDPAAIGATRRNVRLGRAAVEGETFEEGDARALDLDDGVVAATVTNLPFGRQYAVDGDEDAWLAEVLTELVRVTRPGGRVVLLVPRMPARAVVPDALRLDQRHSIRLLGTPTTLWVYDRAT